MEGTAAYVVMFVIVAVIIGMMTVIFPALDNDALEITVEKAQDSTFTISNRDSGIPCRAGESILEWSGSSEFTVATGPDAGNYWFACGTFNGTDNGADRFYDNVRLIAKGKSVLGSVLGTYTATCGDERPLNNQLAGYNTSNSRFLESTNTISGANVIRAGAEYASIDSLTEVPGWMGICGISEQTVEEQLAWRDATESATLLIAVVLVVIAAVTILIVLRYMY